MSESASTLSAVYGVNWVLSIAIDVAFVVVAATVVRRNRPDAYKPLLVWSIAGLAYGVFGNLISMAVMRFGYEGIDGMMRRQMYLAAFNMLVHIAFSVLLVRALVSLAQPPKKVEVDPVGPYR